MPIVHTMGFKITKLKPVGCFCAETGAALTLAYVTLTRTPASTTHTIIGAMGQPGDCLQSNGASSAHYLGMDPDHSCRPDDRCTSFWLIRALHESRAE